MVAIVMVPSATGTISTPTGWTLINGVAGNGITSKTFWALGNVATKTFALTGTTQGAAGVIACYSGVNTTTPMDVAGSGQTNAASANCTAPTLTTVTDQAVVVICGCYNDAAGNNVAAWTGGTGTKEAAGGLRRSPTNTVSVAIFDFVKTPAGATGSVTEAIGGTFTNAGHQVALRPGASTYNDSFTESGSASDSLSSAATFQSAFSEAASAADALDNAQVFAESFSETVSSADSLFDDLVPAGGGGTTFNDSFTESASASDALGSAQSFASSLAEALSAADSLSSSQIFASQVSESLSAADTLASAAVFGNALAESVSAADSYSAHMIMSTSFSEAGSASATASLGGGNTFNESVFESLSAGAGTGGGAIFIFDD